MIITRQSRRSGIVVRTLAIDTTIPAMQVGDVLGLREYTALFGRPSRAVKSRSNLRDGIRVLALDPVDWTAGRKHCLSCTSDWTRVLVFTRFTRRSASGDTCDAYMFEGVHRMSPDGRAFNTEATTIQPLTLTA